MSSSGIIEVDLFPADVDDPSDPQASSFRDLLEEVGQQYHCQLTHFDVHAGTVSFSFDSDELLADILKVLRTYAPRTT